jgi:hypothetical protein
MLGAIAEFETDKNLVELAGRNWLASKLFRAGSPTASYPDCQSLPKKELKGPEQGLLQLCWFSRR